MAQEAGLPEGALKTPPTLVQDRFRLVHGVERSAADRLALAAKDAGYRTELVPMDKKTPFQLGPAAGPLFPAMVMVGLAFFLGFPLAYLFFGLAAAFILTGLAKAIDGVQGRGLDHLPLAYPNELAPLLQQGFELAEAPRSAGTQASPTAEPQPAAPAKPTTRGQQVLARVQGTLRALEAAVEDQRAQLPDIAVRELDETIADLSAQAERLAGELDGLEAEVHQLERQDPESELAALQARLARLDTLERAGEPPDTAARTRLEAEVAALRETSATIQALEGRMTAVLSRLLDIGGTASRVRRSLLEEPEPAKSVEKLGEQLRRQAAAAAKARREMGRG